MARPSILSLFLFGGLALSAALEAPQACTLSFDGRVPLNATAEQFSTKQSLFNPKNVLGPNVTWAEIIEFPDIPPSRVSSLPDRSYSPLPCNHLMRALQFDAKANTKPIGLSLS